MPEAPDGYWDWWWFETQIELIWAVGFILLASFWGLGVSIKDYRARQQRLKDFTRDD